MIWIEDKKSPFYITQRLGKGEKQFNMIKLRSMLVDADKSGVVSSSNNDMRITPIGHKIRKYKLDEFIQLWNVLNGDMSLVGPRPERKVFVEEFKKSIPKYMLRLKMKAGLTGWAQINGWRGNTSLDKRIEFDLYYIKNWSLFLDFKIILLTFWKGLINPHAY